MTQDSLTHVLLGIGTPTAWWLFSTAVSTMPAPLPESRWYRWLYNFLQRGAANHSLVAAPHTQSPPAARGQTNAG